MRGVTDGTRIVDDEQFGPVLPVIRYSDVDEALERANASPWGLGGSIWGQDREKAYALASKMEVGAAWISKHLDFGPHIPFGGAKQSGIGSELAQEGLNEFTQLQIINEACSIARTLAVIGDRCCASSGQVAQNHPQGPGRRQGCGQRKVECPALQGRVSSRP